MILAGIKNDVEQTNCAACILCILFHEEDILRDLLRMEIDLLLMSVLCLYWSTFVKEEDTKNWFGDHIERPLFS